MTPTNTDAAHEAALQAFLDTDAQRKGTRQSLDAAIDAFLAKSLEGADEHIKELMRRHNDDSAHGTGEWKELHEDRAELLTLVTALSAKLKEVEKKANAMGTDFLALIESGDERERALQSKLTAQKAAHAKMLRDEGMECRDKETALGYEIDRELRRLADKIEGEP